jgi:hypothetical protein
VPGKFFDSVPEYMIWYFSQSVSKSVDLDLATIIGVENNGGIKEKMILHLTELMGKGVDQIEEHSVIIRKLSSFINKKMLNGLLKHYNEGKKVDFFIPPSLQKDWDLG